MADMQKIALCLWFHSHAEQAAKFYVSIFKNSRIGAVTHFGKEGFEIHGRPAQQCGVAALQKVFYGVA
jgi:predicted 3-demethylubiquinone-9 3-methyltransferase (glyoxalase superfamily)